MQDTADYTILPANDEDAGASLFPTLCRGGSDPDLTIVTYGGMLPIVERVALELKEEELDVEIVVPSLLSPVPRYTLLDGLLNRPRIGIGARHLTEARHAGDLIESHPATAKAAPTTSIAASTSGSTWWLAPALQSSTARNGSCARAACW